MTGNSLSRLGLGALVLGGLFAASAARVPQRASAPLASAGAGVAPHLVAFGSRGPAQGRSVGFGKLDGALADLARHAYRARAGHALEDLHSLSPAARFAAGRSNAEPMVLVDAVTRGDPRQMQAALMSLGLEHPSLYLNDLSGWLPVRQIEAAAARAEVHSLRAAMPHTRVGVVTSQGDYVQRSAALRTSWPALDGRGVQVGVLSDSFDCYHVYAQPGSGVPASGNNGYASNGKTADAAHDTTSGDLPASVTVLEEAGQLSAQGPCMDFGAPLLLPFGDEGRAMLQIVHDVAPGAALAFHTAVEGEGDFASGITALANAGAKVIVDDVGYFDEPFFQDSLVGQAIDSVATRGVAYFSSAGNDGQLAYDNLAPVFNTPSTNPAGEMLLNFDTSGGTTTTSLPVTIAPAGTGFAGGLVPGEFVVVVVEWDQPFVTGASGSPGASSQIDVCVTRSSGGTQDQITDLDRRAVPCTGPNSLGVDPIQIMLIGNPANASGSTTPETVNISVGLLNGSPAPGRIKVAVEDNGAGSTINSFYTPSPTLQGHPGAEGSAAVGAAFFVQTPACGSPIAQLEPYSSQGGDPILFDSSGAPLMTPVVRQKPDFVAPDGVNNTFLGFVISSTGGGIVPCQNNPHFPLFAGTSAAAPHAAAVAALLLQSNSALTAAEVISAMRSSAASMATPSPDFLSGYGFVQADAALALLPPGQPTISVTPTTVAVGGSSTLTWSASNVSNCTASGSWSGTQSASGSQTVTPTAAGTLTYTLTCDNPHGSAHNAAALTVSAAPPSGGGSGGGGGAFDAFGLLTLMGLLSARLSRGRRGRHTPPR